MLNKIAALKTFIYRTLILAILFSALFLVWIPSTVNAQLPDACLPYDVNGDGVLDSVDSSAIAFRVGTQEGDFLYDAIYDIDGDGDIDSDDLTDWGNGSVSCQSSASSGPTDFPSILQLIEDPLQGRFTSLGQIISLLVPMILILGGMLSSILLIWGGIKYISARGDPKAVDSARGTITSAIIGLAILASIFVIATILQLVFKIRVLTYIAAPVYAQGVDIGREFEFAGQRVDGVFPTIGSLFTSIINFALAAGGLLFFFIIIWGGIRYMLSRGDEKQLMDARQTLTNGIIGILIIVSAFAIIKLIELATGATISIL